MNQLLITRLGLWTVDNKPNLELDKWNPPNPHRVDTYSIHLPDTYNSDDKHLPTSWKGAVDNFLAVEFKSFYSEPLRIPLQPWPNQQSLPAVEPQQTPNLMTLAISCNSSKCVSLQFVNICVDTEPDYLCPARNKFQHRIFLLLPLLGSSGTPSQKIKKKHKMPLKLSLSPL
jgi:hypothetical protein